MAIPNFQRVVLPAPHCAGNGLEHRHSPGTTVAINDAVTIESTVVLTDRPRLREAVVGRGIVRRA
jgi:hypothetical protein